MSTEFFDLERLADTIEADLPELEGNVRPLTLLGEGFMSWAVETPTGVVFRIPKRQRAAQRAEVERLFLADLAPTLSIDVPSQTYHGPPSDLCPWGYSGYAKVPGAALDLPRMTPSAISRAAENLGKFFAALHAFPLERAGELGVLDNWREEYLQLRGAVMPRLAKELTPQEYGLVDSWWEEYLADGRNWNFAPAVVHGDVGPQHLLVSEDGNLTGVIDFGEVMIGDPAVDFGGLVAYVSPAFAQAVLASYREHGGEPDVDVLRRGTTLAMAVPFFTVLIAVNSGEGHVPTVADGIAELRAGPILSD